VNAKFEGYCLSPEVQTRNAKALGLKPVIAVVGAIGSGKSSVARLLGERGGYVIAADPLAHEALKDSEIRKKILARFGTGVLDENGEIARSRLAALVFAKEGGDSARRELESWIHPWVRRRMSELLEQAGGDPAVRFVVLDVPMLLEAGWKDAWDRLIYVYAPRDVQLARLAHRGWPTEQLQARERAQLSPADKAARADATIDNGGSLQDTARQIDELLRTWKL
jgi:dephospho-CoA kinase